MPDLINPIDVDTILQNESDNLDEKIKNVKNATTSQKRMIQFNDSYSKRMSEYTRLVMVFVFALGIAIIIKILKDNTVFVPDAVLSIVYILLASSTIIYSIFIMSDITSREKNNFDKLDLPPPIAALKTGGAGNSSDLEVKQTTNTFGYCLGSNCCSINTATIWDSTTNVCKAGCAPGTYKDETGGCAACPVGTSKFSSTTDTCTRCPAGYFADTVGSTVCSACAVGKTSNANGSACS